jgi:hypothetical protein
MKALKVAARAGGYASYLRSFERTAMRTIVRTAVVCSLLTGCLYAQNAGEKLSPPNAAQAEAYENRTSTNSDSNDTQHLRADLQRLKGLLSQMRTNLAFVQSSQTPLKHQFELEADAWQVIVEQMERRLERMEKRQDSKPVQK